MTTGPWHTAGADRAVMREKRIVIQDDDGRELIHLGKDDDGRWTLTFRDDAGNAVLRSGEFSDTLYGMQALDVDGNERVRIGELSDGDYGLRIKNRTGSTIFEVTNQGQVYPQQYIPMGSTGAFTTIAVDDATYGNDGIWFADFYATGTRVELTHGLSWASGTYDVRVRAYVNGSYSTLHEVIGLAASTTTVVDSDLPYGAVGTTIRVQVEARRTSGSDLGGLGILQHIVNYG